MRIAPSATSCCCEGWKAGHQEIQVRPTPCLDAQFLQPSESSSLGPTCGFATVAGQPGYFATTHWNRSEDGRCSCPLGPHKSDSKVADALGLLVTSKCYLRGASKLTTGEKHGTLIFDGVECKALPDCSVELTADARSEFERESFILSLPPSNIWNPKLSKPCIPKT